MFTSRFDQKGELRPNAFGMPVQCVGLSRLVIRWYCVFLSLLIATTSNSVFADFGLNEIPARAQGIGVDEKLGTKINLDTAFTNERGEPVTLKGLLAGGKPILLTLNYSGCPGLCVAQLDGLTDCLDRLSALKVGADFQLVSISIDPRERPETAAATKTKYTRGLDPRHDPKGWHFWVGGLNAITQITKEVGFRYTYDAQHDRYNHAAVAIAISPEGKITRYLYEVGYEPETIRLAIIEAAEGKVGTTLEQFLLWCMHYDAEENRYSADARKLLSLTAGITALLIFGLCAPYWFGKRRNPPASVENPS